MSTGSHRRPAQHGAGARPAVVYTVIAALLVAVGTQGAPAVAAGSGGELSRSEYESCQAKDAEGLRLALEAIMARAIKDGLARVDYQAVVADQWRKVGLDEVLDRRIDAVVDKVASEQSLWSKGQSIFDKEKARELATEVAERVYRADDVKAGIDALASAAARDISKTIELATLDAGEPTLKCLQAFLGPRYGSTIARSILQDASRLFEVEGGKGVVNASPTALSASQSLTGIILIIVRRQLASMAGKIGQRIVGVVLSRLAGTLAGGIGAALILKDLWDWRNGVLPIVASEMKTQSTKDQVRTEIAKTLGEQIGEHTRDIATQTSERVVQIWREFQRAHAQVVDLADRNGDFRAFVDLASADQLPRIDEIVAIIIGSDGEAGVLKRLEDGRLRRAVTLLDATGLEIARDTRSVDTAVAWVDLAGARLELVTRLGLHRRADPRSLAKAEFQRIAGLGDTVAITRLVAIKPDVRAGLLQLEDAPLRNLARALDEAGLAALSDYLTALNPEVGAQLLRAVAAQPGHMQLLGIPRVRTAILASSDQAAAVAMMLRSGALLEPEAVIRDIRLVTDGRVSPVLLLDRHPAALSVGAVGVLFVLLLFNRLLFGRRRKTVPAAAAKT